MAKLFTNSKRTGQQVTTKYFRKQLDAMYLRYCNSKDGITLNQLVSWCGEQWTYSDGKRVEHSLVISAMRNTYPTVALLPLEYWSEPLPSNLTGFKDVLGWLRVLTPETFQERVKAREVARQEAERVRLAAEVQRKAEFEEKLRKARQEAERKRLHELNEWNKLREIAAIVNKHHEAKELRKSKEIWRTLLKEPTLEEERLAVAAALRSVIKSEQVVLLEQSVPKPQGSSGKMMVLRHYKCFEEYQRENNSKSTFRNHWVIPTDNVECLHGDALGLQFFDRELCLTDTLNSQ
jgi:hypothetical protein